ncbi:heme transporter [uncultured Corynebacterium sp.]|uniref:heme transporter n=1 Tax=uncultured Corynebacterium sp. TaxID=159447 RepID=UPI00262F3428|nr:heme transporter [uncultured Corynebacterium sp.]
MFEELEEEAETKDEPSRVWWQWWAPIAMVAVFVGLPPAVYQLVPGLALLILMAVLTVVIALADGATFRASWTIFCVAGLAYFAAMSLYFNEGTWIYLPVFVFLAWAASKLGAAVGSKAGKS